MITPKKKFFLFKQSNHFCSVPWNHIEVYTDGTVKTCSRGMPYDSLFDKDFHSITSGSDFLKELRTTLVNDRPHENCVSCYNLSTKQEHADLRNHYNSLFKTVDVDYENNLEFKLNGVDLHWDNTCNLKCIYCNPGQSSSIAQEQKITFQKPRPQHLEETVDLIIKNQWDFKEIYLSGGEPMLIKYNYDLLQRLENVDIPIRINSNLTQVRDSNKFYNEIKRFRNVLWTISGEAAGDRFNYIRHGANWNDFLQSVEKVKDLGHNIRLNSVWFLGSMTSIFENIEFFATEYNVKDITINQLTGHPYFLVRNAPDHLKQTAREQIKNLLESGLIEYQSNSYYNIARCVKELDLPVEDAEGYKDYLDSLDKIRGTNWRSVFTELV
jgi:pyruvate-formate lyase-activating enzyme